MYLLQEHHIKTKLTGGLYHRLPSLNALDTLNYTCLTMGFPMITVGIITGAIYAQVALGAYWRWDPKEVWALITWFVYVVYLHLPAAGWKRPWLGPVASCVGFAFVLFTYLGVSYLLPSLHSYAA